MKNGDTPIALDPHDNTMMIGIKKFLLSHGSEQIREGHMNLINRLFRILRNLLLLHRIETAFFLLFLSAWGSLLALSANPQSPLFLVMLGTLLNAGIAFNALLGNSYCDYELDRCSTTKTAVTSAIESIGKNVVLGLVIVEIFVLAAIFYHYQNLYASTDASFWFWFGIIGRLSYNFPPIRFKTRGILNMPVYAINFGFTPIMLGWSLISDNYPPGLLLIAAGTFLMLSAQALWGAAVDYESDKKGGAVTIATVLGQVRSLRLSQLPMIVGTLLFIFGIYLIAVTHDGHLSHASLIGLIIIGASFLYSIFDRFSYVLMNNEEIIVARMNPKFRQLIWLSVPAIATVIGSIVIAAGK